MMITQTKASAVSCDGWWCRVGAPVGALVGTAVGKAVGALVGALVGGQRQV